MRVLDIYHDHAWWFDALDPAELSRLRQRAIAQGIPRNRWRDGTAFFLGGDASTFNFQNASFDEIRIINLPAGTKQKKVEGRARVWLKEGAEIKYGPAGAEGYRSLSHFTAITGSETFLEPLARCEAAAEVALTSLAPVMGTIGVL